MGFKNILVPFFEDATARVAFHAAAVIAKRFDAHITAIHMRQRPTPPRVVYFPLGGAYPPEKDDAYKKAEDDHVSALRQFFGDLCKECGVGVTGIEQHTDDMGATASWRDEAGRVPEGVASIAASFDLVVAAAVDGNAFQSDLIEELLFQSGRPVLICPATGLPEMSDRAVIAWNGSAESAAAAAASLPFLQSAKHVRLLTVREASRADVNTSDIAHSLHLHGVDASESVIELEKGEDASDVLLREIGDAKRISSSWAPILTAAGVRLSSAVLQKRCSARPIFRS